MVGTEFIKGQGLGNQLFCYVSARCIARDLGYEVEKEKRYKTNKHVFVRKEQCEKE
jgi:hypothetical protein